MSSWSMPEHPEEATLTLIFSVEEPERKPMVTLDPPGSPENLEPDVDRILVEARLWILPGAYRFETDVHCTRFVSGPDGITREQGDIMALSLTSAMRGEFNQLVSALTSFPTQADIKRVACGIGKFVYSRRCGLDGPMPDVRTLSVKGVSCIDCGFGEMAVIGRVMSSLSSPFNLDYGVYRVGTIHFHVNPDGTSEVGFLYHHNPFASFFNGVLASQIYCAIKDTAHEAALEICASGEIARAIFAQDIAALRAMHELDQEAIQARVEAIQAEHEKSTA